MLSTRRRPYKGTSPGTVKAVADTHLPTHTVHCPTRVRTSAMARPRDTWLQSHTCRPPSNVTAASLFSAMSLTNRRRGLWSRDPLSANHSSPAVVLQPAHAVAHVSVPVQRHVAEVPHLDVAVVVAGAQHPLAVVVAVAEGHGPALALGGLGLHVDHWPARHPHVPHLHTALAAPGDELRGPAAAPARTVYAVDHLVAPEPPHLLALLEVVGVDPPPEVPGRQPPVGEAGASEGDAVEAGLHADLGDPGQLAAHAVDLHRAPVLQRGAHRHQPRRGGHPGHAVHGEAAVDLVVADDLGPHQLVSHRYVPGDTVTAPPVRLHHRRPASLIKQSGTHGMYCRHSM